MRKDKGFTLIEVIVVIVIVGILAMISVPLYRKHVLRSVAAEGRNLVYEVADAQEIYRMRNQDWYMEDNGREIGIVEELGLDARKNRYFKTFTYNMPAAFSSGTAGETFTVRTTGASGTNGEGITVTLKWSANSPSVVTVVDANGNTL
ncbi:MAG: prepilin-type N-terminal cleavage/methylation domain-containing protein [Endomicrobia bacterium]|nr:prepilin-type N-terminal cleavage/methylation domain-containing protein [Endomicrobiia bacterium]